MNAPQRFVEGAELREAPTISRAYSVLTVKSLNEGERVIQGIATTPTPDRMGDIVEPLGVNYKNPMPLLWQHQSDQPVGQVRFDKPSKDGITFTAKIAKIDDPGRLKDRVDEAWQSVKAGLVRAVSIGFRPIEMSFMDNGIRFIESEVLELSLVTIPAQQDALIETIKSIDAIARAASGNKGNSGIDERTPPGVTGQLKPKTSRKDKTMTIAEQMTSFEAKRQAANARMTELMNKAAEGGVTLEQAESDEYDSLEVDVKNIDAHLVRLSALDKQNKAAAKPIENVDSPQKASEARSPVISVKPNVPPGTAFTRFCLAHLRSVKAHKDPLTIAKQEQSWHNTPEVFQALEVADIATVLRASQPVGSTLDGVWAGPLTAYNVMAQEFIDLLRPATIIGRIPGLRRVPFNIQMPRTTAGTSVAWVGEGAPKPVTGMTFDTVTMRWAKAAGIVILTDELIRFSNPSAEAVVRADLVAAMAQFLDRQFVDPSVAAVTNVSPASITNGVTPTTATGTTAAAFRADVNTLLSGFLTNNYSSTASGVWIMSQRRALALSLMVSSLGVRIYPDINTQGGTLLGYPVVLSENVPSTGNSPTDGDAIIFALANEIMLADDGQVVIDASREASVQMDTAPDSPPTASTNMISLWQLNCTGLRAERWINWLKRRSTAVAFIQNARYAE
jgi:HK97 family phage major capsid protein/HK97 family phage prohead protease